MFQQGWPLFTMIIKYLGFFLLAGILILFALKYFKD
jgi:hypothetical protein